MCHLQNLLKNHKNLSQSKVVLNLLKNNFKKLWSRQNQTCTIRILFKKSYGHKTIISFIYTNPQIRRIFIKKNIELLFDNVLRKLVLD